MTVSFITTKLTATAAFQQVAAAPVSVGKPSLDTAKALKTLLRATFTGGSFDPLTLGSEPVHPSLVYQLVSSGWLRLQGFAVAYTETYVLFIRAATMSALVTKVDAVVTVIEAGSNAIEVTDMLTEFDDVQKLYRCNMEIAFTQPAGDGTLAAALVYPLAIDGTPNQYDADCSQRRINSYGVITLTTGNNVTTLRDTAEAALVGQSMGEQFTPLQLKSGSALELPGGLQAWHDIYFETQYTTN
ncbi:MAG: hypothetical protein OEY66_07155 [Gammaproteobacteria bacterium]|nr:hypothetical protein [Gammaproteobacteria bacterium]